MNTTELLVILRAELFDVELPHLWSDELLYHYIDDAQKQFCRDTYGIMDSRKFKLSVKPGLEWYKLDPSILKLRDAADSVTGRLVPIVAIEKAAGSGIEFSGLTAPIRALVSGMDENMLRAWPIPNVPCTIELRTFRLPATVGAGDDFEVAEHHHRHLLNWAKHLAYDVQDTEVFDKQASERYRARHIEYCDKSRTEQDRQRRPVSSVFYGGI